MAHEPDTPSYSLWYYGNQRYNLVVLTGETLYYAGVRRSALSQIDKDLEEGRDADDVIPGRPWKIPFETIECVQIKHSRVVVHQLMNKQVMVTHNDGRKSRRLEIVFESQDARDAFVQKLNDLVGPWPFTEADESPWHILARYLWIMTVVGGLTLLFSGLQLGGQLKSDSVALTKYFDAVGVWGIFVPGVMICLIVLTVGILQLRTPPIIVTYQPQQQGK
jgi:hypothetical protein